MKNPTLLGFEETWMTLELWTRKVHEPYTENLAGHSTRSLEDRAKKSVFGTGPEYFGIKSGYLLSIS